MYLYYFSHALWNQFKRFVRTWAFVMVIVFATIGGLLVYAIRWYYQRLSALEELVPRDFMEFFDAGGLTGLDALELGAGVLILGILVIQTVGAEKSVSRVFLQADVNLLFASDLSPQAVLSFRLMTTLGLALAASLAMLAQTPLMMRRFGLGFWAALSLPLAWCLTLGFSILLKILIYEFGSNHPFFRRNLRWFILGLLAVLGVLFYQSYRRSEEQVLLLSAHRFLNRPWTRWIPVWGWIKGVLLFAMEGRLSASLLLLGLNLGLMLLLIHAVRHTSADYYEQTLNRAQELALLREELNRDGAALLITKLGNRRDVRERDGFHIGSGSGVYFYKVLYNRFRFSRSRLLTRTSLTYLFAAVGAGLFDRAFMDKPTVYIPALVLAAMVFFRTIVSPVSEDIRKASFLLQPDPIWSKLFFSALGGSCNCALDVVLPLAAGSVAAGFSPLDGLAFVPVLAGVDFFASTAGAFVDVSLPASIGVTFKQVIQILLLYIGLIFDGMLLVGGIAGGYPAQSFAVATGVNLLFGAFFLGLTGVWLYPCSGRAAVTGESAPDVAGARKSYSRLGLALTAMFAGIHIGQLLLAGRTSSLVALHLPIYGVGFPLFLLLLSRTPAPERAKPVRRLGVRRFLPLIPVCCFAGYGGNLLGQLLWGVLRLLLPLRVSLPAAALSGEHPALQAALLVFAAPLMEEYVFRRCVIDRLRPFGERAALLSSALLFGLFHSGVNQVCYAFLLGLVFGYVYLRTGLLRYTAALHILVNGLTTLVLPLLLYRVSGSVTRDMMGQFLFSSVLREPSVLPLVVYIVCLFVLSLLGAVLFVFGVREHRLKREGVGMKTVCAAPGFLGFLACAGLWLCLTL